MKEQFKREKLSNGVYFSTVNIEKFSTSRISVNLIVDLRRDTVTANALVAFLLRKGCGMYPDFTALNLYLDELYGAVLSTDVKKSGDNQIINITGVCINDRFALEGEKIRNELAALICNVLTDPVMENGLFSQKEIDIEKKVLCDTIRSVKDDKGAYVIEKLVSKMCADEPYGLPRYGFCEDMETLTAERVTECYRNIISNSRIEIICSGENVDDSMKDIFANAFSNVDRNEFAPIATAVTKSVDTPRQIVEKLNITQSKVALGFTSDIAMSDKKSAGLRLMSAIYGGAPSSKLFMNVREKMSLCYYCASTIDRYKGIMIAYSGVQEQNREKAIDEMLRQLDDIRNGNFTAEELEQARASIITGLESLSDSLYGLETWYFGQILCSTSRRPEDDIQELMGLTADDVIAAAKAVKLNTVYSIVEGGDAE